MMAGNVLKKAFRMSQVQRLNHDVEWAMRAIHTHRAVLILDPAGRIMAANQSCLGMCGYQRDELIGRSVVMLLDHAEKAPDRLRDMLQGSAAEARIHGLAQVAKSGRRFRVDARICPIRDEDGQICLNVLFLRESIEEEEGPLRAALPGILAETAQVIRLPGRAPSNPWSRPGKWLLPEQGGRSRLCDGQA